MYEDFSEEELLEFFRQSQDYIDAERDEDYEINEPQWKKLVYLTAFFASIASSDDSIFPVHIQPKRQVGDVIMDFLILRLDEEIIPKFCQAISAASVITFEARQDELGDDVVHIEIVIPNVYIKR